MSPSFLEGDYVVSITPKLATLKPGSIIIFNHPNYGMMIKEIIREVDDGYLVQGTAFASTSTESIGVVTRSMIQGKVLWKIS